MIDNSKIITIDVEQCIQCEGCIVECPKKALELGAGGFPFCIESLCIRCGNCVEICPVLAITMEE